MEIRAAQNIGVEREHAHEQAKKNSDDRRVLEWRFVCMRSFQYIDRERRETEEGEAIPVRRGRAFKRKQKVERENRQSEPEKIERLELRLHARPARYDRPDEGQKQNWRIGQKMLRQENEDRCWMKSGIAFKSTARAQMIKRDPGVLRVPNDRRDRAEQEYPERE